MKTDDGRNQTPTGELATKARDEFLGAWEEVNNGDSPTFDSKKWDIYGDHLAHINHVAEDDERGQVLKEDLIQPLRDEAAKMNQKASAKVAPLEELEELLERAKEQDETESADETEDDSDDMTDTEDFDFTALEEGDTVEVKVEARDGDMKEDEIWTETIEFVKKQNLKAQSRTESYEFGRTEDGRTCYLRFSAHHSNNLGFVKSKHDQSEVDFDAMWQDIFTDDRDWYAAGLKKVEE